jgi:uncharacterized protein YuzB (UPF0349 family)
MKIRFCEHNKGKGKVYRRLREEYPDMNIKIKNCIEQCKACGEKPMATVGGKKVTGHDGDELYAKIIEAISKKQEKD